MLLVIVDEPRIRRRREHAVVSPDVLNLARVVVNDGGPAAVRSDTRELLDPRERVERVPPKECSRRLHRPADALVLVAPVLADLWRTRRLEVEVRGAPGRARRA
jgi:hypothetical protein